MPRTAIYANGVDLCDSYSMVLTGAPGLWDGFALQDQSVQIPRRMGELVTDADAIVPAREFTLQFVMRAATVAARIANEDALNQLLMGSVVEIVRIDLTTRARYGRPQALRIAPAGPAMITTNSKVELVVKCHDPLAYDLATPPISFGATRTVIPGGTAAFAPRTHIANATAGTLTNFTITQRSPNGAVVATMVLTGALLTGEYLDIDHAAMSLWLVNASNVRSSARSWLTSGTYLVLLPGDSLEVDKGVGTAYYSKAYY